MQDTSRLIINHIRIMIEEAERTKTEIKVSLLGCFLVLIITIIASLFTLYGVLLYIVCYITFCRNCSFFYYTFLR